MSSILNNARQNYPEESGITLLFTLGIGASYFQEIILQDLNLTDWINLRLGNKRHNTIVKPLRAIIMSRCKSRRYDGQCDFTNRWPLTGFWERNIMDPSKALEEMQMISSVSCTVSWPHDNVKIQPCTKLQGWLKENKFAGPCSEIVCRECAYRSAQVLYSSTTRLYEKRTRMTMCRGCQTHEMSRHPHGFRSCICERNLGPVEDGGWKCHNCLATAIYVLSERATTKLKALEHLYRTAEGKVCWDTKANGGEATWSYLYAEFPCPRCLTRRPDVEVNSHPRFLYPTAQYCTACDGIIVKATRGNKWEPSNLAPNQALASTDKTMLQSTKEPPLTYAALDPEILSYKQGLDDAKTRKLRKLILRADQRADGWSHGSESECDQDCVEFSSDNI